MSLSTETRAALHDAMERFDLPNSTILGLDKEIQYLIARSGRQDKTIRELQQLVVASAEEIGTNFNALCDKEGGGPRNLLRNLEESIGISYPGYSAGAFAALQAHVDDLEAERNELSAELSSLKQNPVNQPVLPSLFREFAIAKMTEDGSTEVDDNAVVISVIGATDGEVTGAYVASWQWADKDAVISFLVQTKFNDENTAPVIKGFACRVLSDFDWTKDFTPNQSDFISDWANVMLAASEFGCDDVTELFERFGGDDLDSVYRLMHSSLKEFEKNNEVSRSQRAKMDQP